MYQQSTQLHSQTLLQAQYKLQTASSISNQTYFHQLALPLYISSQESSNLHTLNLLISSTLFDVNATLAN
jgi:hypothetical protein